jgi:lipid-binding SYLF domain-containing protein
MHSDALAQLYEVHPYAEGQIAEAAGYAVFSNVGVNLLLLSTASGWGIVHETASGQDTYMKMYSAGIGPGLGVKDFRGIFVFTDPEALESFVEDGWDASAQADATAKAEDKGDAWAGAVDVAPGIKLYQLTETGLALQARARGCSSPAPPPGCRWRSR